MSLGGGGGLRRLLPAPAAFALALALLAPSPQGGCAPSGPDLESLLPVVRGLGFSEERRDLFGGGSLSPDETDEGGIRLIACALSWLGVPYRLGGFSRSGVDCSGFLNRVISSSLPFLGEVPRRSDEFAGLGSPVEDIEPGDILLFSREGSIYHVGLALSKTTFIHSASEGARTGVVVSGLWEGNWRARLSGVRRLRP